MTNNGINGSATSEGVDSRNGVETVPTVDLDEANSKDSLNESESGPETQEGNGDAISNGDDSKHLVGVVETEQSLKEEASLNGDQAHDPSEVEQPIGRTQDSGEEEVSGDEDGDDSEEDEEEEEEEEEEEPALKYERMGGSTHELLERDSASSLAVSNKLFAMGTHVGVIHAMDYTGKRIKSYRPHSASITDICIDSTSEFIASSSIDGQVVVHSLTTQESYAFDMKRPMRTVALEPQFAKRSTRAFVCGGMAGKLVKHEKGWLGHRETVLYSGESPIWTTRWRGNLIAWATDSGVLIYDTNSDMQITQIDRPPDSPRADLFKCNLYWQDDTTLLIAWADIIKVARIRARPRPSSPSSNSKRPLPPLLVELTAMFAVDCMISGIVPYPTEQQPGHVKDGSSASAAVPSQPRLPSFLILAYHPPDTSYLEEATMDRTLQARKLAERPELQIISRAGQELSSDVLGISGYQTCGCNDYVLAAVPEEGGQGDRCYVVLNPKNVVLVRPRDRKDHIQWLVDRMRYEEALEQVALIDGEEGISVVEIGQRYIEHLIDEGDFEKAASLCPKVLGQDAKRWENWVFVFAQQKQLPAIIPFIPMESPQLGHLVYEMILAHYLTHDRVALLDIIKTWPSSIYDVPAVIVAVQSELSHTPTSAAADTNILMECLAELYLTNRQPGKALPYVIRLRRPNVFDLIRDNNLFTDVQDQALLLLEFDQELVKKRKEAGEVVEGQSPAINLLVDHTFSIPVARVVQQLQSRPYFLYLYLDALFDKDSTLVSDYADYQVGLYAEYEPSRLIEFLRASSYYSLEKAYKVCKERDYVTEMVFLLGRMGNNKEALNLIIERLGDVNRAIDFAKEQNDDDLWEDLLRYSESRPAFIRGLLENVGADIDPIRLIRRIKNGLEIPGLKEALIKILQAFNLQVSLMEGCQTILDGDCATLAKRLQKDQTKGFFGSSSSICRICNLPLQQDSNSVTVHFLCRHVVHLTCVSGGEHVPKQPDPILSNVQNPSRNIGGKIAFASVIRGRIDRGCPVCYKRDEGDRT